MMRTHTQDEQIWDGEGALVNDTGNKQSKVAEFLPTWVMKTWLARTWWNTAVRNRIASEVILLFFFILLLIRDLFSEGEREWERTGPEPVDLANSTGPVECLSLKITSQRINSTPSSVSSPFIDARRNWNREKWVKSHQLSESSVIGGDDRSWEDQAV